MVKGSSIFRYTVPQYWYKGVYEDKAMPCKAGRSFTLAQPFRPESAILIIHGYTGYPGEVVRPARDLFALGYDVYAHKSFRFIGLLQSFAKRWLRFSVAKVRTSRRITKKIGQTLPHGRKNSSHLLPIPKKVLTSPP